MNKEITLTQQELDELKNEICFREKVMLRLKQLNGLPDRVTKVETKLFVQWFIIGSIVLGIFSLAFRILIR